MKWTPVSRMLPEYNDEYLVAWKFPEMQKKDGCAFAILEYTEDDGFIIDEDFMKMLGAEVVAWMPLPTPYVEGREV